MEKISSFVLHVFPFDQMKKVLGLGGYFITSGPIRLWKEYRWKVDWFGVFSLQEKWGLVETLYVS